ncbi:DEAD/DEAH box helicase family protein [Lachnospiraceae bacterium ZAX-1]
MIDFNDIILQDNQIPTFSAGTDVEETEGSYAIQMSAEYGYKLDPWQETILNIMLSKNIYQIGYTCPRQNGKTAGIEAMELYGLAVLGQRIIHTAHRVSTAEESYHRICTRWFENPKYKELNEICDVSHTKGRLEIEFDNGGRIVFMNRSAVAGRGFSVDWIVLDEAQEMNDESWSSLTPTLLTSPDARIVMTGTPPLSSRDGSGVIFQRYRKKAFDGELSGADAYLEWGVLDLSKTNIHDEAVWKRVNPSWDYRVNKNVLRGNHTAMEPEAFAREHLGYWYKTSFNTIFSPDQWDAGLVKKRPSAEEMEKFAIGVVFSQDGEQWCYSIGMVLKDGTYYVELMDYADMKKGTKELMDIIDYMRKKPGFVGAIAHGRAGTQNLIGDCDARKIPNKIIELCRADSKAGSNSFFEKIITTKEIRHIEQPKLTESVLSLDKYLMNSQNGGFGFLSRNGNLIASESAALALYWAKNKRARKTGGAKIIW